MFTFINIIKKTSFYSYVDWLWLLLFLKVLDIPLTVKMRTGISDKKVSWNAHKLITNLKLWDVSLVTVRKLKLIVIFFERDVICSAVFEIK